MHISCQILLGSPDHTLTTKYPTQTFSSCLHPILPFLFTSHPSLPVNIPCFPSCLHPILPFLFHPILPFLFTSHPSLPVYIPFFSSCFIPSFPSCLLPILLFLFTYHPSFPVYIPSFPSCLHPILPFLLTSYPSLPVYIPCFLFCLHPISPFLFTSYPSFPVYIPSFPSGLIPPFPSCLIPPFPSCFIPFFPSCLYPSLPVYIPSFPSCLHPILHLYLLFPWSDKAFKGTFVNRLLHLCKEVYLNLQFPSLQKITRAESPPFFIHSSLSNICLWKGGDISSSPPSPLLVFVLRSYLFYGFLWIIYSKASILQQWSSVQINRFHAFYIKKCI